MSKKNEILVNNEPIDIENIYQDIRNKIINAREKMFKHIDTTMTEVYWYVGKITSELFKNIIMEKELLMHYQLSFLMNLEVVFHQ